MGRRTLRDAASLRHPHPQALGRLRGHVRPWLRPGCAPRAWTGREPAAPADAPDQGDLQVARRVDAPSARQRPRSEGGVGTELQPQRPLPTGTVSVLRHRLRVRERPSHAGRCRRRPHLGVPPHPVGTQPPRDAGVPGPRQQPMARAGELRVRLPHLALLLLGALHRAGQRDPGRGAALRRTLGPPLWSRRCPAPATTPPHPGTSPGSNRRPRRRASRPTGAP